MRLFYKVGLVVDAAGESGPEVPEGVSWVGSPCSCGHHYTVLVDTELAVPAVPVAVDTIDADSDCCPGGGVLASWKLSR